MSEARTRAFIGIAAGAAIGSAGLAAALLYAGRSRSTPVDGAPARRTDGALPHGDGEGSTASTNAMPASS